RGPRERCRMPGRFALSRAMRYWPTWNRRFAAGILAWSRPWRLRRGTCIRWSAATACARAWTHFCRESASGLPDVSDQNARNLLQACHLLYNSVPAAGRVRQGLRLQDGPLLFGDVGPLRAEMPLAGDDRVLPGRYGSAGNPT